MTQIAARPRAARRWRRPLRAGIVWTALALGASAGVHEVDPRTVAEGLAARVGALPPGVADAILTLLPLLAFALGLRAFARALRQRGHERVARRLAAQLRKALPADFIVLPHYLPRDSGDGEVDVVIIGPTGIFAVEVRVAHGDVSCYQDVWFTTERGGSVRFEDSPSRTARWNATRVNSDVAQHGFVRTPVRPVIVFAKGRIADVASSSVPAVQGLEALAAHLAQPNGLAVSPQRARAIAKALDARGLAFAT